MKRPKQILVVDDDVAVRKMLARVLVGAGYRVRLTPDGSKALGIAQRSPPDLVLLDLKLPETSGWDIFGHLVKAKPLLPVAIITAKPNQFFTAAAAGVGALLEKPLQIPGLLLTVSRLLKESAETRIARAAGKLAEFHYFPASPQPRPI
jgi:DNA-binding NtrC family response regulator